MKPADIRERITGLSIIAEFSVNHGAHMALTHAGEPLHGTVCRAIRYYVGALAGSREDKERRAKLAYELDAFAQMTYRTCKAWKRSIAQDTEQERLQRRLAGLAPGLNVKATHSLIRELERAISRD